jgi:hypothetical protein
MPDEEQITITKGPNEGAFQTVTVTQSQLVFWRNEDTEAHWPSFPSQPQIGPRFQVGPGDNSDNFQPVSSGGAIPTGQTVKVNSGCKIQGHGAETGLILVVADFIEAPQPAGSVYNQLTNGTVGVAYSPVVLTSGGLAPYTHTLSDAVTPQGLTITNEAAGVTVGGTPTQAGDNFAFTVHCKDALENRVDQTYTLTVVSGPATAT